MRLDSVSTEGFVFYDGMMAPLRAGIRVEWSSVQTFVRYCCDCQ